MTQQSRTMRLLAEKYEQLAKTAPSPTERQRFGEYVKLYRQMEHHFEESEKVSERDAGR